MIVAEGEEEAEEDKARKHKVDHQQVTTLNKRISDLPDTLMGCTLGERSSSRRQLFDYQILHLHSVLLFKDMATMKITDLPVDILSRIITVVAKSPDGGRDVALTLPTCRHFLEASNSIVIKRAVCFDNVQVSDGAYLFQRTNGLLNSCAKSGNSSAIHLLAQVILVTCTQLVDTNITIAELNQFRNYSLNDKDRCDEEAHENGVAASFLADFTPVPGSNPTQESDLTLTFHWEFVKLFLLKSTGYEIKQTSDHLQSYIELFTGYGFNGSDLYAFMRLIDMMCIVSATGDRNWLLHYEDNHTYILLSREHFVPSPNIEIIDLWHNGGLFEYLRGKLVDAFDLFIPMLVNKSG